ncbi:RagB/SusD family nutrient uptake outer membrane protein [Marinifilum sp.]|uniref:RagB/SusD family nutrient uptake outer membrane protein n=1 Tax=Marinifilum sp. TaxID=2033137 RepID=UPI003BA85CF2
MKNIIKYIGGIAVLGLMAHFNYSCDNYFDEPVVQDITTEDIYGDTINAITSLNGAYYLVPHLWPSHTGFQDGGNRNSNRMDLNLTGVICDEAASSPNWMGAHKLYYNGSINPANTDVKQSEFLFKEPYYYMRRAFNYLNNVENIPNATESYIKRTSAEARMLVALGYFALIKRYGSVPWIDKALTANDEVDETRMPLVDIIGKVDSIIVRALPDLPDRWSDNHQGRVTKASAYFLRSRLALWAASPLFNTGTPYLDAGEANSAICMGNYDPNRWRIAADRAKEAIDYCESQGFELVNTGDPIADYTFATRDLVGNQRNTEVILFSRIHSSRQAKNNPSGTFYFRHMPPGKTKSSKGAAALCPTQNFVELYETVDGSEVDLTKSNPWANLDPRFHASIIHDKASFGGSKLGIMPKKHKDADKKLDKYNDQWVTGFFMRKFLHEEQYTDPNLSFDAPYFCMRLPELYFNYAEALNEYDPGNADITTYLNKTRERVGMPDIASMGQDEMREAIRNEKAVEMAFEDQRFFDLKRWKMGEKSMEIRRGIQRIKSGGYEIKNCTDDRQFSQGWQDKYYLWPFPLEEVQRGFGLVQNPGY